MMYVQSCHRRIHFGLYLTRDRPSELAIPHFRWTSSRTMPMTP